MATQPRHTPFPAPVGWAYPPTDLAAPRTRWASTPTLRTRHSRPRSAFTLIEVLVVISIILILISLLISGSRAWINSAKRNLTLTRLQILNNMLVEMQAAGQNQYTQQWFFPPQTFGATTYAVEVDAQQVACVTSDAQGTVGFPNYTVTQTNSASTPVPKSFTGNFTNNRALALQYMVYLPPTTAADLPAVVSSTTTPTKFPPVPPYWSGPMYLIAAVPNNSKALAALGPNATISTNGGPPVVVDGWGNPILFCPASTVINLQNMVNGTTPLPVGGLANVCLNVQPVLPQTNPPKFTATVTTITSPDNRPFFASAGPDGDFAKGDDNLYSFEQK